jgi:phage repressor protein C with HTH and peptisase S24 domain
MHPTDGSRPLDPGQQTEGDGDSVQLPIERRSGNSEEPTTNPALVPISVWDDNTPLGADEVELKFLKTWISRSGSGYAEDTIYDEGKRLRMGKITLQKAGVNAETSVVGLNKGDSNEPVIPDGGAVYVDRSKRQIIDGEVYAIYHEGEFRVKLLYRLPGGGLRIRSYNRAEYPDEDYPAGWEEKIRIEGWVWNWSPPIRKWRGK